MSVPFVIDLLLHSYSSVVGGDGLGHSVVKSVSTGHQAFPPVALSHWVVHYANALINLIFSRTRNFGTNHDARAPNWLFLGHPRVVVLGATIDSLICRSSALVAFGEAKKQLLELGLFVGPH